MAGTQGLYSPQFEHDSCGIGFVAHIRGAQSHQIVSDALTILENMAHRGACGCENNSGDGAGLTIQIPHEFFVRECKKVNVHLPGYERYGVGVLFFPADPALRSKCRQLFSQCADKTGLDILYYREVPVCAEQIGATALSVEPHIEHVFVACPDHISNAQEFERKLFLLRNYSSHTINHLVQQDAIGFYIASLSSNRIVYKGQLTSEQLRHYYPDLQCEEVVSSFGLVHSRFATNTFPSWRLAQPFRFIAHNGEINTLQGNLNWLKTSEQNFITPYFSKDEMELLLPVITSGQSDSACLDNMIELLTLCGRSLPHVMMMLIPEAWDGNAQMNAVKKAFYEFHASMMEPWDGPAAICFTDGHIIGATLDRNGLRPSRYCITTDDRVIMASETGVLPVDPSLIKEKGRLQPGKMFIVDLEEGKVVSDEEIKRSICSQQPYADWLNKYKIRLEDLPEPRVSFTGLEKDQVFKYQKVFGYSSEDIDTIIAPMAYDGKEPIGSMGSDVPLAILSDHPQHLSSYFKQLFAQVTNPPIDPIREKMVMSLSTFVGNNGNLLVEDALACHSLALKHPILSNHELEKIRSIDTGIFQAKTLQLYFRADGQKDSLKKALERICRYAGDAVEDGFEVLILSDRAIDSDHAPIPTLLATAAIHHYLIRKGYRGQVGLVIEAGDVWEVHHYACLIGFGATAINPYLALSTINNLELKETVTCAELCKNYVKAVNEGLLKVFSKMGISTLQSYQGAQIFEILGLHQSVVDIYFTGTVSRLGGLDLDDIAREALSKHNLAFRASHHPFEHLPVGGLYKWKRTGEFHLFNPQSIHLLQYATRMNDYNSFKKYSKLVNEQSSKACTLRSMFEFKRTRPSVPVEEVERPESIFKRFATGAMSFGSISHEAHSTLAIAMNKLGGKSNSGEGGEDEMRNDVLEDGNSMRSAIRQVASARFGVTSYYLSMAREIQIKMAQGAKPGEGGQLPGHKVDEWIGKVRHATPGVGLISPPPHHDIYSIEDLAQLIYDLKNANREARINVKLVAKAGVGPIAAGVVKAKADVVLISGSDGGTGASPVSSIKHAGLPWELGLAETHQTLVKNNLRNRVVVQTDGQLRTGRDVAMAILLGAEEWGIATAALVVEGCIMMRKCHLNTCPVGIATQDQELRKQYTGEPEHVINFFRFLVDELREIMAELGYRTINEMVGQTGSLQVRTNISHWKHRTIDLSPVVYNYATKQGSGLYQQEQQDHGLDEALDWQLLTGAQPALERQEKVSLHVNIINTNRTVGTILSNEISKRFGSQGLAPDTIAVKFTGTAGQSFGAFAARGLTMELEGETNDYLGKGLSGARLVVYPSKQSRFDAEKNIIIGNVAFYGATSGEAFIRGQAGERFCVRNSGACAVVEGVGDHGCEYMTGGVVVVLGCIGKNFAAGMSGGLAYLYDVNGVARQNCNTEMIDLDPVCDSDVEELSALLQKHFDYTDSPVAKFILEDLSNQLSNFIKVYPKDYKKVMNRKAEMVRKQS